jgi:RimJ/RimL family protein N-acetyltransferase
VAADGQGLVDPLPFLEPQARGQGLGREAARALHRYLVDYLGLEFGDVWLYRDDSAGRGLFAALGYTEYSHGHEVFYREGRWWDDWRATLRAEDFRSRFPEEIEYAEAEREPG